MAARREAEAAALEEQQRAAAGAADEGEDDPERQAFEAMLEQLAAEMQKVRGCVCVPPGCVCTAGAPAGLAVHGWGPCWAGCARLGPLLGWLCTAGRAAGAPPLP